MLSYAQNAEDVVLQRVFRDAAQGFYVDVGASHPVEDSVTCHFYQRGWQGVNVEPDLRDYEQLVAVRTRDVNINAAVGRGAGRLAFYPSAIRGLGTVHAEVAAAGTVPVEVDQMSLSRIFEEHSTPEGFEFLKVDVEGSEAEVLASNDWRRWRPRVVVVEVVSPAGSPPYETWEPRLLGEGYRFAMFDGLNRFYCRGEDEELLLPRLAAPANVFDNWRFAGEVAAQDALQARLQQQTEAHEATQRELERVSGELAAEGSAHAETRRELESARRAIAAEVAAHAAEVAAHAAEVAAHAETRHELESVYDSTSWRVTSPMRGVSCLAQRMGWRSVSRGAGRRTRA
jgi:FkbM family methyltransferase